jgi:hypothetical protein
VTKVRVLVAGTAVMILGALPSACSTSQTLAAAGDACLNATDCQPGLVCLPSGNGSDRVCSDDLSGVQKTESTDAGAADARAAEAGPKSEAGSKDSGGATQDSFQPPVDSGTGG